jgi:hypothetical protein
MIIDKNTIVNTPYADIINSLNVLGYVNDEKTHDNIDFVGFIQAASANLDYYELQIILENKHSAILEFSQDTFFKAIRNVLGNSDEATPKLKCSVDGIGSKFYLFTEPWSNVCANYYIIQASYGSEAVEILIDVFESDFIDDELDIVDSESSDDLLYNNNGNAVNIDNVYFAGSITFLSE